MPRKLLLINPWGVDYMDEPTLEIAARHVRDDTEVVVRNLGNAAPPLPWPDASMAGRAIEVAREAETEEFDGIVIGCCADPFLDEVRSAVTIPVTAPTEAAVYTSRALGKLAIVARMLPEDYERLIPTQGNWEFWKAKAKKYGLQEDDYSLHRVAIPQHPMPDDLYELTKVDPGALRDLTLEAMTSALREDGTSEAQRAHEAGAEVVYFACAFWSLGIDEVLRNPSVAPKVPVLNPIVCATTFMEHALVAQGH